MLKYYPSIEKSDEENPVRRIETRKQNNWTIIPREGDIHGIILLLFFQDVKSISGENKRQGETFETVAVGVTELFPSPLVEKKKKKM